MYHNKLIVQNDIFVHSTNHRSQSKKKIVSKRWRFGFMVLLVIVVRVLFFVKSLKTPRPIGRGGIFYRFAVEVLGVK